MSWCLIVCYRAQRLIVYFRIAKSFREKWLREGSQTSPFHTVCRLSHYSTTVVLNTTSAKQVHWLADGRTFVMKGKSVHMDRIAEMYSEGMKRAEGLLNTLLEGQEIEDLDLTEWKDNMEDDSVDYSLFTDPDNRQKMQGIRFSLYKYLLSLTKYCVGERHGKPVWNEDARSEFLKLCLQLNRILMLLV